MGAHDRYWCSVYERLCMSVRLTIHQQNTVCPQGALKGTEHFREDILVPNHVCSGCHCGYFNAIKVRTACLKQSKIINLMMDLLVLTLEVCS